MSTRRCLLFLFAVPLMPTGCQRLNDERTVKLPVGGVKRLEYSAPRYDQKVTARISSPGAPVSAYLVSEADSQQAENLLMSDKAPKASLAGKEKAEDFTLEATVPKGTAFVLLLRSDKKSSDVKVKVTGR